MPALFDEDSQRHHPLGDRFAIGRAPDNDLVCDDPMVSDHHAEVLRQDDGTYTVRDLGGMSGTYVGSGRVHGEAVLTDGDKLLVGPLLLRFDEADLVPVTTSAGEPSSDPAGEELRRLRAIVELSRAIGVEHDLDRLLARVLDTCFQVLRADRGRILVYAPGSMTPYAKHARTRAGEPVEDPPSTSLLSQILVTRSPYRCEVIDDDAALRRSHSLSAQGVRSLIAVPLLYQSDQTEWLGVLNLDSQVSNHVFTASDLELLGAVAGQAALAIKNAMLVRQVRAVRAAEWARLARVVDHLPVGVVVLDGRRRCLLANAWVQARPALLGGRAGTDPPITAIAGASYERLIGGDVREEVTFGTPSATLILHAQTAADAGETVVVITDITQERAQQTRAAHQDRLTLLGQLAGGIAHDFNNLLFVIVNYAAELADSLGKNDAQLGDLRMIQQAADSATQLVRQLLVFSRREVLNPRVVELAAHVRGLEKMLRRTLGDRGTLAIRAEGTTRVHVDPGQLDQIAMNLVVNARDAIAPGGRVDVRVHDAPTGAVLEVADNGSGMTPEIAARVFEPYFTTKELGKGTGLGLATVLGIVQHAGGEIAVESALGRGTTFRVALPRTDLQAEEGSEHELELVGHGRVLVVDDDDRILSMTERWLRRAGFEVTVAASGAEAVTCASKESFDFLVSDLVMPGTPGREVAEEIDQRMPDIRVLFISGYLADGHLPDAQFLAKPFDRRTFLAKLRSAPPLQRVPQSSGSPPPGGAPPEDPHDGDDGDGGGAAPLAAVPVFDDATRAAIQRTLERAHRDPN